MNAEAPSPSFRHNTAHSRFELEEAGQVAFASYRPSGNVATIPHVESPEALRGQGTAGRLMTDVARYARARNLKIYPVCSYAVAWFRRNPDYSDILA